MQTALQAVWGCASAIGTRKLGRAVQSISSAYKDTAFYFEGVEDCVALTIDDGISRGGSDSSLCTDVLKLLEQHDAHCTFFVCSKYIEIVPEDAAALIAAGNEFGNHLEEDRFGYSKLPAAAFEAALQATTDAIERVPGATPVRWFRAPQGIFNQKMRRITTQKGLRHAMGDAYCDDWAISNAKWVARTLLKQARPGSIIIMHMPEKGFREHTLEALSLVLAGLRARGLKCVTLSEIEQRAQGRARAVQEQISVEAI
jgi:peptidoglycan/xylan/chitin deacetylase (PgdA/CDA1 family)